MKPTYGIDVSLNKHDNYDESVYQPCGHWIFGAPTWEQWEQWETPEGQTHPRLTVVHSTHTGTRGPRPTFAILDETAGWDPSHPDGGEP